MDFEKFIFIDPGHLHDGNLTLILQKTVPGIKEKAWLPTYHFGLFVSRGEAAVGNIDLRVGYTKDIVMYGGNLAYGVFQEARGNKFAERGCRLLFPLARHHGMTEVWITCNPDNWPSRKTCERLGAELIETVQLPEHNDMYQRGEREKCRYRVLL